MRKKLTAALLIVCLVFSSVPRVKSAGAVYFTAVNSTLLPLTRETMPVHVGGLLYLPYRAFSYAGVYGIPSFEDRMLYLYRGNRSLDFYVATGKTVGQDGHVYEDISAKFINDTFYLPLDFVSAHLCFMNYIIDCEPAPIIRLKNAEDTAVLNDKTFIGYYRERMNNEYNALTAESDSQSPGDTQPPDTQPPGYFDVTVFLSFYNLSSGYAVNALDTLAPGYRSCFFVTSDDILRDPGLMRRIAGNGHTFGIWLKDGTYDEYLEVSELLFEAAKIKTVLVSSPSDLQGAYEMAAEHNLVYWPISRVIDADSTSGDTRLPTISGTRLSMLFSCSENTAELLSEVLSGLRQGEYTVARITETSIPAQIEDKPS